MKNEAIKTTVMLRLCRHATHPGLDLYDTGGMSKFELGTE